MIIKKVDIFKQRPIVRSVVRPLSTWLVVLAFQLCFTSAYASAREYPPLRESIDPKLQAAFEETLDKDFGKEFWDLVKAKKVGIVVADITDPYKPEAEVYRKSGTWRQFHSDSGVIVHEDKQYIIVALVEHPEGGQGLAELIIAVDELMDNMSAQ